VSTGGGIVETGRFDLAEFAGELRRAPDNHELGTSLLLSNERVRVFEVRLEPGERGAFHIHDHDYFWTVVEPGRGRQRLADGTWAVRDYRQGQTRFLRHGPGNALIHDLENVGTTTLRFVTVELTRAESPGPPDGGAA
jgi:quercetin dioxygenase-like cupin family protein